MATWTPEQILTAAMTGIENGQHASWAPQLSTNEISEVMTTAVPEPTLLLALANGQYFEIVCRISS